jgi:hypothetical protein
VRADVSASIGGPLLALLHTVGYHGVFQAVFVPAGRRRLLVDFKPSFFGSLAFDVAGGLPLPLLAYLDAIGDDAARAALLAGAGVWRPTVAPVSRHGAALGPER